MYLILYKAFIHDLKEVSISDLSFICYRKGHMFSESKNQYQKINQSEKQELHSVGPWYFLMNKFDIYYNV